METRVANETQISPPLPGLTHHITANNKEGKAVIHSSTPATWIPLLNDKMAFNVVYTNTATPQLSTTADIESYYSLMQNGGPGLTMQGGTVCRIVDFGPGVEPVMHRTQSLDFGVVIEGEIELGLDGGESEKSVLKRGDVAIQRGTNHAWRNVTPNNGWARMLFVLQSSEEIKIEGKVLRENVEEAKEDAEWLKQK
ncbi:hypothetical protein TWF191_001251 [Orbilia oligospora]|uniref:Cupin type-2 domain-containing protein n=1 Tax=Orbilia oligospora TaxID=2813651 RepID=A0A7C8V3X4_ORBOL|nr:hypothetical protein TWF679_008631 [Orbilia oligospora]KAF3229529.1 hypothetical protein TWF191_001251 [Orbilia oligospora]